MQNLPPGNHKRTGDRQLLKEVEPKLECFQSCQHDKIKKHGSRGAANHVVVKGPFWFFIVNGSRSHEGPRVIGSGFSSMPSRLSEKVANTVLIYGKIFGKATFSNSIFITGKLKSIQSCPLLPKAFSTDFETVEI